jgi:hypothetical protein
VRLVWFFLAIGVLPAGAQRLYRGIVADSAQLFSLPDVHVSVKGTTKGTTTNALGNFLIYAQPTDTLLFTYLGYLSVELPLLFQEDAVMVLLRENTRMLAEVTVKAKRLYPNKIQDRTKAEPKRMDALDGAASPLEYFSRWEREKRKLARVVEEFNQVQVYIQVITDPDVMAIMKETYQLTDQQYYASIEAFNQKYLAVQYYTDPDEIMEALHRFFEGQK